MTLRISLVVVFLLSSYNVNGFIPAEWLKKISPVGFSWGNCGAATNPIQMKSLSITPDPIRIPGNATVSMSVAIGSALPTEIHASTTLDKKVSGFWIKVPCEHDVGSCNYANFCGKWNETCQKYFEKYGFPCLCPIPAGTYNVPDAIIDFTNKLPSQADGEFRLNLNIGSGSSQIGCLNFNFNLKN